jgi:hypothetical protein
MRLISATTYKSFMKKYKLKLSYIIDGKRRNKTMQQMQAEIYEYESNPKNKINNGLYFNVTNN